MTAKCEKIVRKLVGRYFKRAGEEIVSSSVLDALMYEKQFSKLTKEERTAIAMESVSRLEGEFEVEYVRDEISTYESYQEYFTIPCEA